MAKSVKRAVRFPMRGRHLSRPEFRGMRVPYTTLIGDDGVPNFQANDLMALHDCAYNRRCVICGQPLEQHKSDKWIAFIGGSRSLENMTFVDGGMHPECAYYSAETCPFLANKDRSYAKTHKTLKVDVVAYCEQARPSRMMILFVRDYRVTRKGVVLYFHPCGEKMVIDWNAMPATEGIGDGKTEERNPA